MMQDVICDIRIDVRITSSNVPVKDALREDHAQHVH